MALFDPEQTDLSVNQKISYVNFRHHILHVAAK